MAASNWWESPIYLSAYLSITWSSRLLFLILPKISTHSLGFMLPLRVWVPAPVGPLSLISQQQGLHSCPLSPCFVSTLIRELSKVLATKLKQPPKPLSWRMYTHWGVYWRCAVIWSAYSTVLQNNVHFNVRPLFLLKGFLITLSINLLTNCMTLLCPPSLPDFLQTKQNKTFDFGRKFHSLLSQPLGWTWATPKASAHPATSALGPRASSLH